MRIGIGFLSLWSVLASGMVQAELYRYVDAHGGVVLDRHGVPSGLIGNGYEVLNEQGRVIRVVPPAPTPTERARLQAEQLRAVHDAQLLRLYSSVEDVERARARKLAELDGLIEVADGNLQTLLAQRTRLETEKADRDQAALQQRLEYYRGARLQAEASFARDSARLAELLDANR